MGQKPRGPISDIRKTKGAVAWTITILGFAGGRQRSRIKNSVQSGRFHLFSQAREASGGSARDGFAAPEVRKLIERNGAGCLACQQNPSCNPGPLSGRSKVLGSSTKAGARHCSPQMVADEFFGWIASDTMPRRQKPFRHDPKVGPSKNSIRVSESSATRWSPLANGPACR